MLHTSWTGRRVSIRRALDHRADGSVHFGDVVGDLLALDEVRAVIETRTGPVEVDLASVAVARLALPSTADELALEAVAARGWQPAESAAIGGWVLRASAGFSGRGNSVLPLRLPGMPVRAAIDQARAWYAERGLPLRLQVPTEARRLLDNELGELGFHPSPDVHVMAARLDALGTAAPDADAVVAGSPDDEWFGRYRGDAGSSTAARALLVRHERAGFAAIRRDGAMLAVGRGTVDDGWLGIAAVEVAPESRRQGLATAIMAALWDWGRAQGAVRTYLQVQSDNDPAVALYTALGYWTHHDYRYRLDPSV